MGIYLNPGMDKFEMSLNSEIYVDKSDLIAKTNALVRTRQRFICISRPRRFGKTMAAEMLAAYYGIGEDASSLFEGLNIAKHPSYERYLNKYNVLMVNMQMFLSQSKSVVEMIEKLQVAIIKELRRDYSEIEYDDVTDFIQVMNDVYRGTKRPFVILIDEWDCLFREYKDDVESQKEYLDFLRLWLKDQVYVGLAYMTGILPVKKYGTHSALNMFWEYSMTRPGEFIDYFGFKDSEVEKLAKEYEVDFNEIKRWYNGYFVDMENPILNPTSLVQYFSNKVFGNYWNTTETYEALRDYIMLNYDGLKDKITLMLSGESVEVNVKRFTNDMRTFESADDVLTLLIHLGYLTYNFRDKTVRIPNEEIKDEFVNSIETLDWGGVIEAINDSRKLLKAIWNMNAGVVAAGVGKVHEQNASILQYNNENSLSCVISLALYGAKEYYSVIRELPTGKGYADLVFIPRKKYSDKPALVVELKWNQDAVGAIEQIKDRSYISALDDYLDNLMLVGINYDKQDKVHNCMIEKYSEK